MSSIIFFVCSAISKSVALGVFISLVFETESFSFSFSIKKLYRLFGTMGNCGAVRGKPLCVGEPGLWNILVFPHFVGACYKIVKKFVWDSVLERKFHRDRLVAFCAVRKGRNLT